MKKLDKKNIKIAFLTTISQTMDWFVLDFVRHLKNKGFSKIFLISNMTDDFIERNSNLAKLIPVSIERGIKPRNLIKSYKTIKSIFKREKFDVIYYLTPNASFCSSIAGKKAGVPIRIYAQCGIRYVSETGIKRQILKKL